MASDPEPVTPATVTAGALFIAKREAITVLGRRVSPADLPTDQEVRAEWRSLMNSSTPESLEAELPCPHEPRQLASHLDRFTIYKLRLEALAAIKQNPLRHPEGDALYHSLQVFEAARAARPYDEEFLTAALLHDVGKAIEPADHVASGLHSLEGTITDRTAWLIEHHSSSAEPVGRSSHGRQADGLTDRAWIEDLELLRDCDLAGRVPGAVVPTVDEALAFLQNLEAECEGHDPIDL
jgi:hypothetical protein